MVRRIIRRVLPGFLMLTLASSVTACSDWRKHELSPAPLTVKQQALKVRVTKNDSKRLLVKNAYLQGDTLMATRTDGPRRLRGTTVQVPMSDVRRVERMKLTPRQQWIWGGAVLAMFALGIHVLASSVEIGAAAW